MGEVRTRQKRSLFSELAVRKEKRKGLCAAPDRSGSRRQLAEHADRHLGSHNHSVHITQPSQWRRQPFGSWHQANTSHRWSR